MGFFDGLFNFGSQLATNVFNQGQVKEQQAREDNAIQRRVADLKAAGMSPILAAGSPAAAGAVFRSDAPKMETGGIGGVLQLFAGLSKTAQDTAKSAAEAALAASQKSLTEANTVGKNLENQVTSQTIADQVELMKLTVANKGLANTNAQLDADLKARGITEANLNIAKQMAEKSAGYPDLQKEMQDIVAKKLAIVIDNYNLEIARKRGLATTEGAGTFMSPVTQVGKMITDIGSGVVNEGAKVGAQMKGAVLDTLKKWGWIK